ncbi:hypothetical protein E4U42_003700 [Claviceps africana]|uniref:Myb-like DNA-binding domain-containing protein n=1 Tax=Claviceps africana TaxID=83212 RepID=A0A8K0JCF2_9HYPO|nr:hypothetical protein E4U42_003700 [Claviceps africana]
MTPNSDNAMARFLFAILKQKNLKDIDWNQVAQDPVLLQPITNGHAARMRYSRFRATVTGHEAQRRARPGDRDRVSKPYKREGPSKKDVLIKSESGVSLSSLAQLSPASLASPYNDGFGPRFLTPCSDDMAYACPQAFEKRQTRRTSDAFPSMIDGGHPDLFADPGSLTHSPAFSTFEAAYELNNYNGTSTELGSSDVSDSNNPQSLTDPSYPWNDQFHDPPLF